MFRIQNEQSRTTDRAGTLREGGMFRSAANAEIRGERRAEQRAENFRAREIATERFGGRNTGEAFRNFREMMSEQGVFGSNQQDFEKWAKEQAKSEKERQAQESSGATPSKDGSKPTDPMQSVVSKMDKIIAEIMERLPQNALSYN
jgi:Sec-independent protein translocase protein TatA